MIITEESVEEEADAGSSMLPSCEGTANQEWQIRRCQKTSLARKNRKGPRQTVV
jgi:hypothetical protein